MPSTLKHTFIKRSGEGIGLENQDEPRVIPSRAILLTFSLVIALLPSSSAFALPNLAPYQPSGWADKIIVSRVTGNNTDSTSFTATDTLYVDWAVVNNGTASTAARFHTELYVDGALRTFWYTDPPLEPGTYGYVADYSIGSLTAGTHTIRIRSDSTSVIAESSESDNEYTKVFTVTGIGGPNLNSYQPAAWSDTIVVSRTQGTNSDSSPLSATDTLYVDWAVMNRGAVATSVRFYTELYVDGALRSSWYTDPPLNPNFYIHIEDYSIGSLPVGTHTIRIRADSTGVIAETNESDNEYTKTVVITGAQACTTGPNQLCLNNNRFKVKVDWRVPTQGVSGAGTAVPLGGGDTGYFWFFNSANVELVVKVLDGRGVNGYYWVFYGALSDVEYTMTVTDTARGIVKTYFNPHGRVASVADTSAFSSAADPAASSLLATPSVRNRISERQSGLALETRNSNSAEAGGAARIASAFSILSPRANAAPCTPSSTTLCLNGNRFSVQTTWHVPSGATGVGTAVSLTGDTGYFWFFNSANVELVIKVLDGRPVNGNYWVFYGALSDVQYTITVTDTVTGAVRTYSNVQGNLTSRADTSAFTPNAGNDESTAISADSTGNAVFNVGGVSIPIQLIDEVTRTAIPGISVGFALDPASRSYGVLMVVDPLQRYPPQIVVLRGASQGQSALSSSISQQAAKVEVPISTTRTRTIETISTTALTVALRYVPHAGEIKDLAVVGAKAMNRLGVPTGPLIGLDYVQTELLTQQEALAAIRKEAAQDVVKELVFLTGEVLLTGGSLAPVTAMGVGINVATLIDSTNTVLNCGLATQKIRVTRVGPDPLGMKFYECQNFDSTVPLYRVPAAGFDDRGLPLTTGSLELVSKTQIGLGVKTPLDNRGNATAEVPVGDYEVRLTSPGFRPANRALRVPTGGTSVSINLARPSGGNPFDGSYAGGYTGTVFEGAGSSSPVSGRVAFTVAGSRMTVSEPEPGSGTLSSSGLANFSTTGGAVGPCSFTGTFVVSGSRVNATGTWSCQEDGEESASGTWNASK